MRKMLVTWSDGDRMRAYALILVQLISTAADGTSLVLQCV